MNAGFSLSGKLASVVTIFVLLLAGCGGGGGAGSGTTGGGTGSTTNISAPTGVYAAAVSSSAIDISWVPVTGAIGYDVYQSVSAGQAITAMTKIASAQTANLFSNTGLAASTTYYYKVVALDATGASSPSTEVSAVTNAVGVTSTVLAAPTGLGGFSISGYSATVYWGAVAGATGYDVYRSTFQTAPIASMTKIASAVMGTQVTDTGLAQLTTYYYFVVALDSAGATSNPSSPLSVTTNGNAIPCGTVGALTGPGTVCTWADGGTGAHSSTLPLYFSSSDIAADANGNFYIAENYTIRKISSAGVISTLAGQVNVAGGLDGAGSAAQFSNTSGTASRSYATWCGGQIAVQQNTGTIYVTDINTVRMITPAGVVSTIAGTYNVSGYLDGTGAAAKFGCLSGIAVDNLGNVYVSDSGNATIRKIVGGVVTTVAGNATGGALGMPLQGNTDGSGTSALFAFPSSMVIDILNNFLYVADTGNCNIRQINLGSGSVTTFAGSNLVYGTAGSCGTADGMGTGARFGQIYGMAISHTGSLYVSDTGNDRIRVVSPMGVVTTLSGSTPGIADGLTSLALYMGPAGLTFDNTGTNLYVLDFMSTRKITP